MCMYKVDSLCCTHETNTTLRISYTSVFLKNMDPWQDMKGSRETGCGLRRRMRIRGSRKKRGGDTKEGGGKMTVSPTAEQL